MDISSFTALLASSATTILAVTPNPTSSPHAPNKRTGLVAFIVTGLIAGTSIIGFIFGVLLTCYRYTKWGRMLRAWWIKTAFGTWYTNMKKTRRLGKAEKRERQRKGRYEMRMELGRAAREQAERSLALGSEDLGGRDADCEEILEKKKGVWDVIMAWLASVKKGNVNETTMVESHETTTTTFKLDVNFECGERLDLPWANASLDTPLKLDGGSSKPMTTYDNDGK